jgi:hypothetical protein
MRHEQTDPPREATACQISKIAAVAGVHTTMIPAFRRFSSPFRPPEPLRPTKPELFLEQQVGRSVRGAAFAFQVSGEDCPLSASVPVVRVVSAARAGPMPIPVRWIVKPPISCGGIIASHDPHR